MTPVPTVVPAATVIVTNPTSGIPPGASPVPTIFGTPGPAAPPPLAAPLTSPTPGEVVVTNQVLVQFTPVTPEILSACFAMIVIYCIFWPVMREQMRIVVGLVGVASAVLAVLTGAPQFTYAFWLLFFGLALVEMVQRTFLVIRGGNNG